MQQGVSVQVENWLSVYFKDDVLCMHNFCQKIESLRKKLWEHHEPKKLYRCVSPYAGLLDLTVIVAGIELEPLG